ncbi:MAG: GGDEF domain-containing protein [Myxococcales bacterium]|nr:GGDEF domain-containing protein [Myxococcales bacterium]
MPALHPPFSCDDDEVTAEVCVREARVVAIGPRDQLSLVALVGEHDRPWIPIDDDAVIGRSGDVEIRMDDPTLSRRHARLFRRRSLWCVEDLGSVNGTFVDGQRVCGSRVLVDGDRLQIGTGCAFRVSLQDRLEREASRRLYDSSVTDPLTGLHNRRHLDARLVEEVAYARRHHAPLSLLLLDVDHFKRVNDDHGHLAGDGVLRVLGALLRRMLRTEDFVARYGGEELAVVARGTTAPNAMILAERVRKAVEGTTMPWGRKTLRVTMSIGVATWSPPMEVRDLLAAADEGLYRAKSEGRNRCRVAG